MNKLSYSIQAMSKAKDKGYIQIKETSISFGTVSESAERFANPAELFLSAFSSCILKNVERFSELMKFNYINAEVTVIASRLEAPPSLDQINYQLKIFSSDNSINLSLLKRNIEKHGTIFNTVKKSSSIEGEISLVSI